jgi:DNA-damage-inducible protein J
MVAKANINVKIDADVKEMAVNLFSRMGIDQTTAIDMFYRQVIKERGLPFRPTVADLTLDEQIVAAILAKNQESIKLEVNEQGHVIIDKEKHPQIYDWAVNG